MVPAVRFEILIASRPKGYAVRLNILSPADGEV